jgi:hypothetical protein
VTRGTGEKEKAFINDHPICGQLATYLLIEYFVQSRVDSPV